VRIAHTSMPWTPLSPSNHSQLDEMNRFIYYICILVVIIASSSPQFAQAATTPSAEDEETLRNLMSTMARDIKASSSRPARDFASAFTSVLQNAGLGRAGGSTSPPPSLEQIFSVLPRPPLAEGKILNSTEVLQAGVDVAVINLVGSTLSFASGLCNAAATVISIEAGKVALAIAEWNVLSATANSFIQTYQLEQALYGDINSYLAKPDPLSSALSSLSNWQTTKDQIKSSITGQLSQLMIAQKILKAISLA
jgi:hypothetical protein